MNSKIKKIDAIIIVALLVIAGVVLIRIGYRPPRIPKPPEIEFLRDDAEKILKVTDIDSEVYWRDLRIVGDEFDTSFLGDQVVIGDEITNCKGSIAIYYKLTGDLLGSWIFTPEEKLPESLTIAKDRAIKSEDEGEHYKGLLNPVDREWWYYTVVFSEDSKLAGWTLSVSFNHMARSDLSLSKPDILFVALTGPQGEKYGGIIQRDRPVFEILNLRDPVLQATSSDKGFRVEFENSKVQGKWPNWNLHIDVKDIGEDNNLHDLLIDLQFFAPSSPYWIHNKRPIDNSKAMIASYVIIGCEVEGSVEIDGLHYDVEGIGHHEHTWATGGILTKALIRGWDWAHIKMENGWNVYYSNYYFTSDIRATKESKTNPLGIVIVTNDQGKKITILENVDIKIEKSDDIFLLLNIPTETKVTAAPSLTQIALNGYDIKLNINLKAEETIDHSWKIPAHVGMKLGSISASGSMSWSDDYGDHEVQLNGIGTIWDMRH